MYAELPRVSERFEALAKVLEGVPVLREDQQLLVSELGGFDQFPQLQELRLLLQFANLVAEGHHVVNVLEFLSKLHRIAGRARESAWLSTPSSVS